MRNKDFEEERYRRWDEGNGAIRKGKQAVFSVSSILLKRQDGEFGEVATHILL